MLCWLLLCTVGIARVAALGDAPSAIPQPPAPMPAVGTPQWTGPGADAKPRDNSKLAVEHSRGSPPAPVPMGPGGAVPPECRRIQRASWSGSWSSVPADDQALWKSAKVRRPALLFAAGHRPQ